MLLPVPWGRENVVRRGLVWALMREVYAAFDLPRNAPKIAANAASVRLMSLLLGYLHGLQTRPLAAISAARPGSACPADAPKEPG